MGVGVCGGLSLGTTVSMLHTADKIDFGFFC